MFYKINKSLHIWFGQFAYLAGAVQCYRGVELVSSSDSLIFSTFDIDYEVRERQNGEWYRQSAVFLSLALFALGLALALASALGLG